jgi:hypothetical protein
MEMRCENKEVAALRWAVCSMVAHHNYHRFPATGPKYTAQMLHMWLKHFPGLAMEAAQHGSGIAPGTQLCEKAQHEKLLDRALGVKAVQPEETVVHLLLEFERKMSCEEEATETGVKVLLAPHAGGVNNGCGGCLRECLRAWCRRLGEGGAAPSLL